MLTDRRGCHPNCHGVSRRTLLSDVGMGFTGLVLGAMLQQNPIARAASAENWSPPDGCPHFAPKAKRVIWLMMRGGVSHMESFDPKPMLTKYAGMTIGDTPYHDSVLNSPHLRNVRSQVASNTIRNGDAKLYPLQIGYEKCGESGVEVSDWWPHVRQLVDEMAIIRSMWTTDNCHGAQLEFLSGRHLLDGCFPTLGAWIHYGLGSLNENLPQFLSIGPNLHSQCFDGLGAHYLGAEHGGVEINIDPKNPLPYAQPALDVGGDEQEIQAELLGDLNQLATRQYPDDPTLTARIKSYELAFRMQMSVPEIIDFSQESEATRRMYGLDNPTTEPFGQQLLATRRFAEQGVRFIQVFHGTGAAGSWDAHTGLQKNHTSHCAQVDKPIAGLLKDLKQRGLLDDTILLWTTEFGRTPGCEKSDGRDHHNYGFSIWMAGGGIKPGIVHGATDEIGFHAVENRHYVTDIHATIFQLLGIDARRLEIPGRKRLERDYGHPIPEVIA